jgi:hypothetical protein
VGPLICAVGALLLTRAVPGSTYLGAVLPALVVFGLGLGCTVAPLTTAVFDGAAPQHAGVASGVNNAVARIAGLLAVALLPWVARIPEQASGEALSQGFVRSMWISAGVAVVGAVCAFATVERRPPPGKAARQAHKAAASERVPG